MPRRLASNFSVGDGAFVQRTEPLTSPKNALEMDGVLPTKIVACGWTPLPIYGEDAQDGVRVRKMCWCLTMTNLCTFVYLVAIFDVTKTVQEYIGHNSSLYSVPCLTLLQRCSYTTH